VLLLDRYFTLGDRAMIRRQEVEVIIQLPDSIDYRVSDDIRYLISDRASLEAEEDDEIFSAELMLPEKVMYALENNFNF
jgi:hypothetical protein